MAKECLNETGAPSQPPESTVNLALHLLDIGRHGVAQTRFNMAMTQFFGVQFGRVRWQPHHTDLRMLAQICLHHLGTMRPQAIPHHDEGTGNMLPQMLQALYDLGTTNGMIKILSEDFATPREPHQAGKRAALADATQNGSVACGRPGGAGTSQKRKADFIYEDHFRLEATGFFLLRASPAAATPAPVPHRAPGRGARVAAHSSPVDAAFGRYSLCDARHQRHARSLAGCEAMSNG
jgi:hypothetical protein